VVEKGGVCIISCLALTPPIVRVGNAFVRSVTKKDAIEPRARELPKIRSAPALRAVTARKTAARAKSVTPSTARAKLPVCPDLLTTQALRASAATIPPTTPAAPSSMGGLITSRKLEEYAIEESVYIT
jgi:hypothetical protein